MLTYGTHFQTCWWWYYTNISHTKRQPLYWAGKRPSSPLIAEFLSMFRTDLKNLKYCHLNVFCWLRLATRNYLIFTNPLSSINFGMSAKYATCVWIMRHRLNPLIWLLYLYIILDAYVCACWSLALTMLRTSYKSAVIKKIVTYQHTTYKCGINI
jgi:hypothetical protein